MYQSQHQPPYLNNCLVDTLQYRFEAICRSLELNTASEYSDRLVTLVDLVSSDRLTDLQDYHPQDLTVIAILIGAYWHQDLAEMRSRVLGLQNYSQADLPELILSYAIAYACRDKMQPRVFVNQICQDFAKRRSLSHSQTSQIEFLAQMQKAHKFASQGASAIAFHGCGVAEPVAIALYYFLSTPHDWILVTERSRRYDPLITIQASAISAAYLGKCDYPQENAIGKYLWQQWAGFFAPIAMHS